MRSRFAIVLVAFSSLSVLCSAQTKHRVVVDLFTGGPEAMKSTLGNVANLKKALAGQPLEVEIVAYGPGIDLVLAKNKLFADRLKKLNADGVEFATCANTMRTHHISKGQLFPFVKVVPAGVAEVVLKQEEGWSYLRR